VSGQAAKPFFHSKEVPLCFFAIIGIGGLCREMHAFSFSDDVLIKFAQFHFVTKV